MSLEDKASIVLPKGFTGQAGTLECWNPNTDSLVGLSVVRATTATRVNESGLIESVAANVPRRDFLNGGCGDLLVEPQRTNLATNSNSLASGWSLTNVTTSTSSSGIWDSENDTIITENLTGSGVFGVNINPRPSTLTLTNEYQISFIVKKGTRDWVYFHDFNGFQVPTVEAYFNLSTISVGTTSAGVNSASITDLGNSYFRCFLSFTAGGGAGTSIDYRIAAATADNTRTYSGTTGTEAFRFVHAQLEEGSYATSPIKTAGAAVTRNADVISGTGLAALLGDSAGGMYVEASIFTTNNQGRFSINDGSTANRVTIDIYTQFRSITTVGSSNVSVISGGSASVNTFYKVGIRYALNSFAIYQGGTSIASKTSGGTFSNGTLTNISFNDGSTGDFYGRIRELVIFNEAPDDTQLAAITTP